MFKLYTSLKCPNCGFNNNINIFDKVFYCDNCNRWSVIETKSDIPYYYIKPNNRREDILRKAYHILQSKTEDDKVSDKYKISNLELIIIPYLIFKGRLVGFKKSMSDLESDKSVIFESIISGKFPMPIKLQFGQMESRIEVGAELPPDIVRDLNITPLSSQSKSNMVLNLPDLNTARIWDDIKENIIYDNQDERDILYSNSTILERRAILLFVYHWVVNLKYDNEDYYVIIRDFDESCPKFSLPEKKRKRGILVFFTGSSGLLLGYAIKSVLNLNLSSTIIFSVLFLFTSFISFRLIRKLMRENGELKES